MFIDILSNELQLKLDISPEKANKLVTRYIRCVTAELCKHANKKAQNQFDSGYFVSTKSIMIACGSVYVKGTRYSVWNELQNCPSRILKIKHTGFTGTLTSVELNYELEELINMTKDNYFTQELYKDADLDKATYIDIDVKSLKGFIESTQDTLRLNKPDKYKASLRNYLKEAQSIMAIATENNNKMPHIASESDFGRVYYKGPNLQNTSVVVREAALGKCHKYDLENAVFCWKVTFIGQYIIDGYLIPYYTGRYLESKKSIRNQLAKHVFDTDADWAVSVIKQAISAIGFGANKRSNGYPTNNGWKQLALRNMFTSEEKFKTFIAHEWVDGFITEQEECNQLILDKLLEDKEQEEMFRSIPCLQSESGRFRKKAIISYLYQHIERDIIEEVQKLVSLYQPLLTVHDCIYTKHQVNMLKVNEYLHNEFTFNDKFGAPRCLMTFEHAAISRFVYSREHNANMKEYKMFKAEENRKAEEWIR